MNNSRKERFEGLSPFELSVHYLSIDAASPDNVYDAHIHEECEVYINVSGDVSFVVENSIYPVLPGSIVITRPFEYHHCVYHSNKLHRHFWMLFSCAGNEELLELFFKRAPGEKNLLILPPDKTDELLALCHEMTLPEAAPHEKYSRFFRLLDFLYQADAMNASQSPYPQDVLQAIRYINGHLSETLSVAGIVKAASVSVNSLERHFQKTLHISPSAYIQKKRMANAVKLLSCGSSVTEASEKSGFSDYSGFIALFRKTYGMTPLQYKKKHRS